MIRLDIDFQERSVEITQDNCSRSSTSISTYNLVKNRARLMVDIRGLNWQSERLNMSYRLGYPYLDWVHEDRYPNGYNIPFFDAIIEEVAQEHL